MEDSKATREENSLCRCVTSFCGFHVTNVCLVVQLIGLLATVVTTFLHFWLTSKFSSYEIMIGVITFVGFSMGIVGNRTGQWILLIPLIFLSIIYTASALCFLVYTYIATFRETQFFVKTVTNVVKPNFNHEVAIKAAKFLHDTCVVLFVFLLLLLCFVLIDLLIRDLHYIRSQKKSKKSAEL
ncbi:hypothetical protein M3Y94_00202700 [Aphelenchoides besseyi]|nr:hypothetical protein M3Y94_00202700 [Aphelenchoides besseyi]KAI6236694.1 hypothetical protein M3Y95_00185100 [Aphelenchoides besseyi]